MEKRYILWDGEAMKKYQFGAWVSFGKGDSGETEFDLELTDEEYDRMEALRKTPADEREEFCECKALSDIYEKAYEAAVKLITYEQIEYADYEPDWNEEEEERPWRVDDTFPVTVTAPWQWDDDEDEHE